MKIPIQRRDVLFIKIGYKLWKILLITQRQDFNYRYYSRI